MTVNVCDFGAVGSGVVDDTPAFVAALNASDDVFVPPGDYLVSPLSVVHPGTRIGGIGAKSNLKFNPAFGGFALTTGAMPVVLQDFRISGGSTSDKRFVTSAANNRSGLKIAPQFNSRVRGLTVDGLDDKGISFDDGGALNFDSHVILSETAISNCFVGLDVPALAAAEYVTVYGLDLNWNSTALSVRTGNFNGSTLSIKNNRRGVELIGSGYANNGHGNLTGCLINHSVEYGVYADGITVGFNLLANQLHLGDILIKNSTGVQIANGEIQVANIQFQGGGRNVMRHNFMYPNPALPNTVTHNLGGVSDASLMRDNFTATGAFPDSQGAAA